MAAGSPESACQSGSKRENVSGFILAGGRSSRLGRDKLLLPWKGTTLLGHTMDRLKTVCSPISLCADRSDLEPYLTAGEVPRICDARKNAGPLSGIVAGLEQTQTEWNLFLAVDLPLVPAEFLRWLVEHVLQTQHPLSCRMPRIEGKPQPLCAMYHRSLSAGLRSALLSGTYKIQQALQEAEARKVQSVQDTDASIGYIDIHDLPEWSALSPRLPVSQWFLNVNTHEDWELLQQFQR